MRQIASLTASMIAALAILILELIQNWSVLQPVSVELRRNSPFWASILYSPLTVVVCCAAALSLGYAAWRESKKNHQQGSQNPLPAHLADSLKQSISNTGNQSQTINQYFPASAPQPQPIAIRPKTDVRKPNVLYVGHRSTKLRYAEPEGWIEDSNSYQQVAALVVCFRNEHPETGMLATANNIRACVNFYDPEGQEIGEGVSNVSWLGKVREINLVAGESACMIPLLLGKDDKIACPYFETVYPNWGEEFRTDGRQIPGTPSKIRITLFEENEQLAREFFQFYLSDGKPQFKRLPRA